jgi:small subunit ribosomal protein S3
MGQKVHPYGFRVGIINNWKSRWFASKDIRDKFLEDANIKNYQKEAVSVRDIKDRDRAYQ